LKKIIAFIGSARKMATYTAVQEFEKIALGTLVPSACLSLKFPKVSKV